MHLQILKAGKFVASIERPKAGCVSASGVFSPAPTPRPGPMSFAYCSIYTIFLLNTIYDICAIGLLF